jgi:phosphorylcholine metabolism protein LicD
MEEDTTKQCQKLMLDMLVFFDGVCTKHNIPYAMIGGTLIGALRHQGWIPWDMDIDVAILEDDLPRLKRLLMETMPPVMFFQDKETDPYCQAPMPKIRNRHSNYYEWLEKNPTYKHHNGLQLDIFPYKWVESRQRYEGIGALPHFQENDMFPLVRLPFEHYSFLAPQRARELMELAYKTLEMPPENERVAHEGKAHPFTPCIHPESITYHQ